MTLQVIGKPLARIDGRLKVTGAARYAAEFNQPNQAYAVIVSSSVGLGRVTGINAAAGAKPQLAAETDFTSRHTD